MILSHKTILPIALTVVYTVALLLAAPLSKKLNLAIGQSTYLSGQLNYQIILLGITAVSLFSSYLLNKSGFGQYFSIGQISASAQELKAFGIKQGDTWMKTGLSLCLVISSVTAIFMYFQLKQTNPNWSALQSGMLWILLFSLSNSFAEEMIYRIGIVSPLSALLKPTSICFISAILFGLPHFAGMPNGIIGATMAGVLGFVLAKSLLETNGIFWAWVIHFVQDVIIIGTLFLMSTNTTRQ
jgi:membrane protease YdiL (CAAX protease family)